MESLSMKKRLPMLVALPTLMVLLQGCIAFPPLVQVEHKDNPSDQQILQRLDAIDHRLDQIEQNQARNDARK